MEIVLRYGDCLDVMQEIPNNSVCDLPYGKETDKTMASWDKGLNYDELF